MTLDRSHYRCPTGEPRGFAADESENSLGEPRGFAVGESEDSPGKPSGSPRGTDAGSGSSEPNPRPLLPNMSEATCGQARRHRAPSCAARLNDGKATGRHRPSGAGRPACCACRAADQEAGHIHSSRCRSTRPDQAWAMRQPDEPVANFCGLRTKGSEARSRRPSPPLIAGRWWCHRRRWWSKTGSNRRPHACKARALPTELLPRGGGREGRHAPGWWAWEDSNFRPHAYQARALTN